VKRYASHTALKGVSITVPENSIYGLLGPNGAGKTSLIRIITQITAADKKHILFAGEALKPQHTTQIGYLPEERGLYRKMKVAEQLLYLARLKDLEVSEAKRRINQWLERLSLNEWRGKNVEDLSKGMQQKVQFIATVIHQPRLIILDEPFSGFDPVNANLIRDEILELRKQGSTIIFSTHRMETVEELCDHIALINKSEKVLEGSKADIKRSYKSDTYVFETTAPIQLPPEAHLLETQETNSGTWVSKVHFGGKDSSPLLSYVMNSAGIISFREDTPSMHDIFIKLVKN
jgi:ABC-2 type transport system ATP-binding protein